ncbi:sodium channel protein type 2 subunit alpha-like protein [Lates japonicus]|uniref:Sodium channel protein type 2 subunit alpha-like protein n=1 Tax=Lates japonicus TaxID=270547 RepID=A0AAD3RH20_LATJO|nr:sodium channel protein type 2 subunit alpha-like protein [Lates japonicus]
MPLSDFSARTPKDDISLSEGSTVDLRKPGEEEDEYSEMAEEAMDPDNCFPDSKYTGGHQFRPPVCRCHHLASLLTQLTVPSCRTSTSGVLTQHRVTRVLMCAFVGAAVPEDRPAAAEHKQHSASLLLPLAVSKTECVCRPEWRRSPAANYSSRKTKGRLNGNVSARGANESETLRRKETPQMNEGRRFGF